MRFRLLGLTLALLFGATLLVQGDDWPRFRGHQGLGLGTHVDIPVELGEASARWKIETKGHGHSSPVIVGKKLFYTVAPEGKKGTRDLVCLSTDEGKELWRKSYQFSEHRLHQFNSPSSTSPAVDAERVYLWWSDGEGSEVFALDHEGEPLWKTALGTFDSQHGCGSSVALADGVLMVQKLNLNDDSFIAGLNPATGKLLWKTPIEEKTKTPYVTPVIRDTGEGGGQEALFVSTESGLFALDVKTGKHRWRWDAKFEHRCVASPVVSGNYIFASCGGGGGGKDSVVLQAAPGAVQAKEVYRLSKQLPYVPTGLGIEGKFFFVNDGGVATCYDAESGDLRWRERLLGKCFASLISVEDRIYAFGRDGDYKIFRAAGEFELLGEGQFPAGIHATPAVADGKLFVRTDEKIYCFENAPSA